MVALSQYRDGRFRVQNQTGDTLSALPALLDAAPDAIYIMEPSTLRILSRNLKAAELDGYSDKEIANTTADVLYPSDQLSTLWQKLEGGTEAVLVRHTLLKNDGHLVQVEANQRLIDMGSEKVVFSIVRDITERSRMEAESPRLATSVESSKEPIFNVLHEEPIATPNVECKRADKALQHEKHLLHTVMDNVPDLIYFKDLQSHFTRINVALAREFGLCSPIEAVGKSDHDIFSAERADEFYKDEQEIIRTGTPMVDKEEKLLWPSGRVTWMSTTKMPFRDSNGNIIGTFGISRDITARKQAEEKVRETSQMLHMLVQASPVAIIAVDLKTNVQIWNPAAERLLGWSEAEVLGKPLPTIPESRRELFGSLFQRAQQGETIEPRETQRVRKDGSVVDVITSTGAIRDASGAITGFMGILTDISEYKRADQALRESEEKYRSLVSNIPDVLWKVDDQFRFAFISNNIQKVSGYSPEEVYERGAQLYLDSLHPDDVPMVTGGLQALLTRGEPFDVECRMKRRDGEWIWVHDRAITTYDKNGVRYAEGALSDITERKRAERALWETGEQLEAILNNSSTIIYLKDATGRYIRANRAFEDLFGLKHQEAIGKTDHELFLKEVADKFRANDQRVLRERTPLEFEETDCHDGNVRTYLSVKFPLYGAQGTPYAVAGISTDITERKRAEEQRHLQTAALESAANGIVIAGRDGRINWVNPAFTRLTGYPATEVIGKNPRILKSGVQDVVFYQQLWNTILSGEVWHRELVNRRKDGTLYNEEMTITPVRDDSGTLTHFIAIKQDITARKRAEEELRLTQFSVEQASDAIYWMDSQGRIVYVNEAACRSLGRAREELLSLSIPDIDPFFPKEVWKTSWEEVKARGSLTFETQHQTKQGRAFPVEVTSNYLEFHGKEYAFAFARDIAERKRAEEELHQSRQLLQSVLDTIPQRVFWKDRNLSYLGCNKAFAFDAGLKKPSEIVGKNDYELDWSQTAERYRADDKLVIESEVPRLNFDEPLKRSDGSEVWLRTSKLPLRDRKGKVIAVMGTYEDITAHREIERMKSEIVSVVSHELRTPLTSIRGALGLLAGGLLRSQPEKGERMLEIAVSNTDRLVRLINDILDLERLESGKMNMEKRTCNAAGLMTQAADEVRGLAEKAGVTLSVTPYSARLWVDPDRIIQALINLLSNAIKFSRPGETIWLSATPQADQILFQVKDHGRGIPKEKRESIFERFQQVDASDRREKGGTGLGLPITRSIMQQHGGRIWVESTLGQGSTFSFTLPPLPAEATTAVNGSGGRKVLVCAVEAEACSSASGRS